MINHARKKQPFLLRTALGKSRLMFHQWFVICGILWLSLFRSAVLAENIDLASELYEEDQFSACVTECERILADSPENSEAGQLKKAAVVNLNKIRLASGFPPSSHSHKTVVMSPFLFLVRCYQHQISPAASPCPLYPSCSAYAVEAIKKHGLLGIPMTGDRLIREASAIRNKQQPAIINGRLKIQDPLTDHDLWMKHQGMNRRGACPPERTESTWQDR